MKEHRIILYIGFWGSGILATTIDDEIISKLLMIQAIFLASRYLYLIWKK